MSPPLCYNTLNETCRISPLSRFVYQNALNSVGRPPRSSITYVLFITTSLLLSFMFMDFVIFFYEQQMSLGIFLK
jgi:hypothetical protein